MIQLINLAFSAAETEPDPLPEELNVTGRFAALWGVTDIVNLGGILHTIPAANPTPASSYMKLEIRDDALVNESKPGIGTVGEPVQITRDEDGEIFAVRFGAMSAWPIETFRQAMSSEDPRETLQRMSL